VPALWVSCGVVSGVMSRHEALNSRETLLFAFNGRPIPKLLPTKNNTRSPRERMQRPAQYFCYAVPYFDRALGARISIFVPTNFHCTSHTPPTHTAKHVDEKADHDPLDHDHDHGKVRTFVFKAALFRLSNVFSPPHTAAAPGAPPAPPLVRSCTSSTSSNWSRPRPRLPTNHQSTFGVNTKCARKL